MEIPGEQQLFFFLALKDVEVGTLQVTEIHVATTCGTGLTGLQEMYRIF